MSLERETILLVEDDPHDTALLERTFQSFRPDKPFQVVSSGEMAIQYLAGEEPFSNRDANPLPTLLFLDLKLPGLSGFELLTWVRQQPRLNKIPVVVLTGSRKSLDVYRAYELGASSYLVKPVKAEDIARLAESLKVPWLRLAEQSPPPSRASRTALHRGDPAI